MIGIVDCHAHVIDPRHFPYADGPGYKPGPTETGTAHAFLATLDAQAVARGVLVQPSCYGYDNTAMLAAIVQAPGRLKGIAVVPPATGHDEMAAMREQGVVGARLNLGSFDPDFFSRPEASAWLRHASDASFLVEVYAIGDIWAEIAPILAASGVKLIIDHLGHPDCRAGIGQPGFQAVLRLARETNAVVKLSSAFRVSHEALPHSDLDPFAHAVIEAFGTARCIWGSDWPFIGTAQPVRYQEQLALLGRWLPEPADRLAVLRETPERIFGWAG